ncbi:hypothetical protein [Dapis sp. BLCC M172]|uniref:hypothetical protein n=1 Tax=Dapis sp. BLCC M172 TaxID=2975281 RepID=UPI003CE80EE2
MYQEIYKGDREQRCDPATTKVARECAPREGTLNWEQGTGNKKEEIKTTICHLKI